jgi:hypothetical protein
MIKEPLRKHDRFSGDRCGEMRLIPWDTEIFGFPVGEFLPADELRSRFGRNRVARMLRKEVRAREFALLSARLPAVRADDVALLGDLGFRVVDYALEVRQLRVQRLQLPNLRARVRQAEPGDRGAIVAIAEHSFHYGRYHTDGHFPRPLANRRYGVWVRKAMETRSETHWLFVLDAGERVVGFFDVNARGPVAELRLGAVDAALEHGLHGYHLYVGVLNELRALGMEEVVARVSAANTAVLNLYAAFGFQFGKAEVVMHHHVDRARIEAAVCLGQ